MAHILEAEERKELGKNANRRLRATGKVPSVLYGQGAAPLSLSVDYKELDGILHSDTGQNTIFTLKFGSSSKNVLVRDYQLDPIRGNLIHADFQSVSMDQTMSFEVPVLPLGESVGVKAGGVLDQVLRQIELECLPTDVPDNIPVEISHLDIGQAVRVSELKVDTSKVRVLSDPELVVLTISPPHVVEEEEDEVVDEEETAEPELIKKGKEEGAGPAGTGSAEE